MERQRTAHELIESSQSFVRNKACKFARQRRCANESEDLQQEVMLQLVRRCHRFNPQKASWPAFANVVCRTQLLSLLEQRCAQRRSSSREAGSLNTRAKQGTGDELVAILASGCHAKRLGGLQRSEEELSDLHIDLEPVLDLLPPLQQQICRLLKFDSPSDVARELRMSRGKLYDQISQIRDRFDDAGLREYV